MSLAENPRARLGGNHPPADDDEEKRPPKSKRVIDKERWKKVLLAGSLIAARFKVPRTRILANRTGGEDGRALRRFLIMYARSLNAPVWECEINFELNRKQIGEEVAAYIEMLALHPQLNDTVEKMTSGLDYMIDIEAEAFLTASIFEIEEDAAIKRRLKADRKAGVKLKPDQRELVEEMAARVRAQKRRELQDLLHGVPEAEAIAAKHMGPEDTVRDMSKEARAVLKKLAESAARGSYPRKSTFDADKYVGGIEECETLGLMRSAEPFLSQETNQKCGPTAYGGTVYLAGVAMGLIEKPSKRKKEIEPEDDED